jgi:hypothetical protein
MLEVRHFIALNTNEKHDQAIFTSTSKYYYANN